MIDDFNVGSNNCPVVQVGYSGIPSHENGGGPRITFPDTVCTVGKDYSNLRLWSRTKLHRATTLPLFPFPRANC